jgi:hypothetical protein
MKKYFDLLPKESSAPQTDLMEPRFIVINEDTSGHFFFGETLVKTDDPTCFGILHPGEKGHYRFVINGPWRYPHLFRRLEWWERREVEDLPKYLASRVSVAVVKVSEYHIRGDRGYFSTGAIVKEGKWKGAIDTFDLKDYKPFSP